MVSIEESAGVKQNPSLSSPCPIPEKAYAVF